jgi:outer membrane receptor for ferrienterochelin and colicins
LHAKQNCEMMRLRVLGFGLLMMLGAISLQAQHRQIDIRVSTSGNPVPFARVQLEDLSFGMVCDSLGYAILDSIPLGKHQLTISAIGFETLTKAFILDTNHASANWKIELHPIQNTLKQVVISGTLKEVSLSKSPVLVELYTSTFFRKNPTSNLFDGLQLVNGVRPQLNCNVCNTGDIHINGLEGPYTMVMIDGMPIVNALSSVYGMSGIPSSLIERVEVVKGPASSLYGSEAIGGLINVITKKPSSAPKLSIDFFSTSWAEANADIGFKFSINKKADVLTGVNYFNYQLPKDKNGDNFTDVTLQHRVSLFQKWAFQRRQNRKMALSARYYYEDRWGGEMNWTRADRGGNQIYGESIFTSRAEVLGYYELPVKEKMVFTFSGTHHDQNSAYGQVLYRARQQILFGQLIWDKSIRRHSVLAGLAMRYTYYNDNTPAMGGLGTTPSFGNRPQRTPLPGLFLQDEISLSSQSNLLIGIRTDYHANHGLIYTPRIAYKWNVNSLSVLRINAGTGFRVVNLFSEEHAALTGARKIQLDGTLKPEQSYNVNVNMARSFYSPAGFQWNVDLGVFYTYFTNRIVADYESNPNEIRFGNSSSYATGKGITFNTEVSTRMGIKARVGATWMENLVPHEGRMVQQLLTEKFTGVWQLSYSIPRWKMDIDYTGNLYSPMRLPLLGPLDKRAAYSPWWSLQNIQLNYKGVSHVEFYGGIKNLLNFTPPANSIARPFDPFDKQVSYDANGQVLATPENPQALTFDPTYVFAPNQGRRWFLGTRIQFN